MNLNEQPVCKKKVLRSLRDFLYESICSSWYRNENSNIIKLILNELGVKTSYITSWNCYLLRMNLYANLIKAKGFSFLNFTILNNFIVDTLKITQTDQHLHLNNFMIMDWDSLAAYFRRSSKTILEETFNCFTG